MKGLVRSLARGAPQKQAIRRQRVLLTSVALVTSGLSGVGFGSVVIGDLPEGNILFQGAVAYLKFTKNSAGTIATFAGNYSVGSTPTADATLSSTDADLIGSSAIAAAVAGVSAVTRGVGSTTVVLDNTDGSLEINLNVNIDDASVSADAQSFTVTGYVDLVYSILGDD